jgi:hypothetical protein
MIGKVDDEFGCHGDQVICHFMAKLGRHQRHCDIAGGARSLVESSWNVDWHAFKPNGAKIRNR